jgi:hypothetical protein
MSTAEDRKQAMRLLDDIWRGWCQDEKCPNNLFFGLAAGSKLRIRLPDDYRVTA